MASRLLDTMRSTSQLAKSKLLSCHPWAHVAIILTYPKSNHLKLTLSIPSLLIRSSSSLSLFFFSEKKGIWKELMKRSLHHFRKLLSISLFEPFKDKFRFKSNWVNNKVHNRHAIESSSILDDYSLSKDCECPIRVNNLSMSNFSCKLKYSSLTYLTRISMTVINKILCVYLTFDSRIIVCQSQVGTVKLGMKPTMSTKWRLYYRVWQPWPTKALALIMSTLYRICGFLLSQKEKNKRRQKFMSDWPSVRFLRLKTRDQTGGS